MGKFVLMLIFFSTLMSSLQAQNNSVDWAPTGAKWWYSHQYSINPMAGEGYWTLESIMDTIINGISCKKIEKTKGGLSEYEFMYADSNKIYRYVRSGFHSLYDFSASQGDTLNILLPDNSVDSILRVVIDSTGIDTINGIPLRVQYIHSLDFDIIMHGKNIEHIGNVNNLLPYESWYDPPESGPLRCYEDSVIGIYKNSQHACDTVLVRINENNDIELKVNVYPNPTYEQINITISTFYRELNVRIFDIQGKEVISKKLIDNNQNIQIDISELPQGVFNLQITLDNLFINKKLIVEK